MADLTSMTKAQIIALLGEFGVTTDTELTRSLRLANKTRAYRRARRDLIALVETQRVAEEAARAEHDRLTAVMAAAEPGGDD